MSVYSHSRLSTFEQCRQRFKFAYVDRIEVPGQGIEAFMGSVVHEILEELYKGVIQGDIPTSDEIISLYGKAWDREWSDDIRIVRKGYTPKNYFNMGMRFLRSYYSNHHPFDHGVILGLETEDFLDLGNGYSYHIRIDRLMDEGEGIYSVNDYKTGKRLPARESLDSDRQLGMYSLWVRERYPDARRIRLIWHFLAHDRHLESERNFEELSRLKDSVMDRIREIEECRSFETNVTALCPWCDYRTICPAW